VMGGFDLHYQSEEGKVEGGKQEASRVHADYVLKSRTRPKASARAKTPTKRNARYRDVVRVLGKRQSNEDPR